MERFQALKYKIRKERKQDTDVLNNIRIEDRVCMGKHRSQIHNNFNKVQMAKLRKDTVHKLGGDIGITFGI